ncbi:TatD family hydrolase [Shewanella insulae]|uniref:TatD family hydrolase n=1 Tax=Shewanella insulae TaxID=2681496 RepID=UPI001EFDBD77|nr:TatD family hydrolase [Shewanella insulae]MCG9754340.1 TatD family hydrolase [Shewanella insulae]
MPSYIDIAVNLVGSPLEQECDTLINDAAAQGVSPLIVIGSSLDESQQAIDCVARYPNALYTTAGVHPHHASEWDTGSRERLTQLVKQSGVVAIGECGLDYNRDFSPRPKQREAFEAQLALAVELEMPVLMHERDAHEDFAAILQAYRPQLKGALLHCFTGNRASLEHYIEMDLHLGITGWVCDERRGQELAELVVDIPAERIMIETDSPYLLPRSMRPKPKSSKNKPQYLPYIGRVIAELRGESKEAFARQAYHNSCAFFGLEADYEPL